MKRLPAFVISAIFAGAVTLLEVTADEKKPLPDAEPIELSGRFRRPPKWTPQLEIIPAGQMQRIDLQGKLIRDIKDGTPVKVWGVVRSQLFRGGTATNPSPFGYQWIVWLEVTKLELLNDPMDVLK